MKYTIPEKKVNRIKKIREPVRLIIIKKLRQKFPHKSTW